MDTTASQRVPTISGERLLRAGDATYDEARQVWNGMVSHRPAVIARVESAEDVVAALALARAEGLPVSIRGGGHNVAGLAVGDGALVIDLSAMTSVSVDPVTRRARVGGGARWKDLDAAAQAHGLATPGGVVSDTGVAGLTLSGGLGWLRNKHGLSCDALRAATVVTADGRTVRASADEHPDLFWGLRGGGGQLRRGHRVRVRALPARPHGRNDRRDLADRSGRIGPP
jgi:FAD/FMN-containing dehydrogenase